MVSQLLEGLLRDKPGGYSRGGHRESAPAGGGLPDLAAWAEKIRLPPWQKSGRG